MQLSALEEKLFGAMKGFVTRFFGELTKRVDELERREPAKGDKGEPGKDADPALIEQQIAKAQETLAQRLDAAVARIPVPKDGENGKSVTVDDVRPLLTAEVTRMELDFERRAADILQRAIDKIPAPLNGKDADEEVIAGKVLETVMRALDKIPPPKDGRDADPEVVRLMVRDEVSKAVSDMPAPKDGRDGIDGKSVELPELMGAIMDAATKAVAAIPVPKDGRDGKDGKDGAPATAPDLEAIVKEVTARIPTPKDGKDGKDGVSVKGDPGRDGVDGKDGISIKGDPGRDGVDGAPGERGLPGERGEKGMDGRDGTSVTLADVTPLVETAVTKAVLDLERRGMDAINRAIDKLPVPKDGKDGVNGRDGVSLDAFDVSLDDDDQTLVFTLATPECEMVRKVRTPLNVYRGVYTAGHHTKGSSVTYGGSQWIARRDTDNAPPHDDWTLAVKRGRDAK
jgi:hypothetical protein